jgi:hypothetical protein
VECVLVGIFSFSFHGLATLVSTAGGRVTPAEGASCSGVVPATAVVTTPAGEDDGSVPAVPAEPAAGTSSPGEAASATLCRLGWGDVDNGLQCRFHIRTQQQLDSSENQRLLTRRDRWHVPCASVPPGALEGPVARFLSAPRMIRRSCPSLPSPQPFCRSRLFRC